MKQYEYTQVPFADLKVPHYNNLDITKLDEMGAEGWEFICIDSGACIFKREKPIVFKNTIIKMKS